MHRALQLTDILHKVFLHFSLDTCGGSLARCASVCQTFRDPALDRLWSEITTLVPLFSTLARRFVAVPKSEEDGNVFVMQGPIQIGEWSRFRSYAKRVLKMTLDDSQEDIHPSVFLELAMYTQNEALLPSLVSCQWSRACPIGTELLLFMAPSLSSMTLFIDCPQSLEGPRSPDDYIFMSLLRTMESKCPLLENLTLNNQDPREIPLHSFVHFSNLRSLDISEFRMSQDALLVCAELDNLVELIIDVIGIEDGLLEASKGFMRLEKLDVTGTLSSVAHLLKAILSPVLWSIIVSVTPENLGWKEWHKCFVIVGSRSVSVLRNVVFIASSSPSASESVTKGSRTFLSVIRPLLNLHKVEEITLDFLDTPGDVSLEDNDVKAMANAWPTLVTLDLRLRLSKACESAAAPSLVSLVSLAQSCPQLQNLCLPSLRLEISSAQVEVMAPLMSHGLKALSIDDENLSIPKPIPVARVLDRLFPRIEVDVPGDKSGGLKEALVALQSSRQEQVQRTVKDIC